MSLRPFQKRSQSVRPLVARSIFILVILVLTLAALSMNSASTRIPLGSHIPQIENSFVLPDALSQSLVAAATPGSQRLSDQQLSPFRSDVYRPAVCRIRPRQRWLILFSSSDGGPSRRA